MDRPRTSTPPPKDPERAQRARSLPSARPFRVAVCIFAIQVLGLIAALTGLAHLIREPSQAASRILLGGLAFSAAAWFIAFFKRRSARCPLCKGTPLVNSIARTHIRATRIRPFNHGVTAMLSILAIQKFRCMYCGTDFDLLKPPTRLLQGPAPAVTGESPSAQDSRS